MILQSLRDLALREHLVDDPAFESKSVRWVVELDGNGRFLGVLDTNMPERLEEGSKKKPRLQAKLMTIPRRAVRASNVRSNYLVDNAKYVFGWSEDPDDAKRTAECHAAYLKLLQAVPPESIPLAATLLFLASDQDRAACAADLERQGGFASNDLFTFRVDGTLLHDDEVLQAYWGESQATEADAAEAMQCLVCGEHKVPARLHNQIQIRGASTSGVPLVSFNTPAFEKYGWSGNENAPVCTDCMTAYVEGLRRLTRHRTDPLSTVLNGDTTAVYWADSASTLISSLPWMKDQPSKVKELLHSPRTGTPYALRPKDRFFCMILTGVQGRITVRRVHTGTVADLVANLRRYFAAIHVDRYDTFAPLPQFRLLQSMVLNGELNRLNANLATELWFHALFGLPLSRNFLSAVMGRNIAERKVTAERAALLHLYFASHAAAVEPDSPAQPQQIPPFEEDKIVSLDRDTKDPPYLLGRLLAALENLQTAAQGSNLNRTLVDRTFGAACTRPGVVFPQLIVTAQHHMAKAGKKAAGRAINLDKLLGEIIDGLDINAFSATLNLEQQGRFALGYYHQRQSFYRKPGTIADLSETVLNLEETA